MKIAIISVLSLAVVGCGQVRELTPEQMQQIRRQGELMHEAYHSMTGMPCEFERGTLIYMPAIDGCEK